MIFIDFTRTDFLKFWREKLNFFFKYLAKKFSKFFR